MRSQLTGNARFEPVLGVFGVFEPEHENGILLNRNNSPLRQPPVVLPSAIDSGPSEYPSLSLPNYESASP